MPLSHKNCCSDSDVFQLTCPGIEPEATNQEKARYINYTFL